MDREAEHLEAQITTLAAWISESQRIVFFGGAGVSTESGIPDFRSADGLYAEKRRYPPEQIVSHSFFLAHTEQFYDFYKERMLYPDAEPNAAHLALAALERQLLDRRARDDEAVVLLVAHLGDDGLQGGGEADDAPVPGGGPGPVAGPACLRPAVFLPPWTPDGPQDRCGAAGRTLRPGVASDRGPVKYEPCHFQGWGNASGVSPFA